MGNERYDIAVAEDGDDAGRDGDFYFAQSDQQHIADTINAWPGWWKEFPLDGVAVAQYSKSSSGIQLLARKVRLELQSDGYQVDNPIITLNAAGLLEINPNAVR
jgi:hypothetical protein